MKTVVIGMSGGVDSSVAAILLKEQGYKVIGLFMRNWDSNINNDILGNPNNINDICPQEKDYIDALNVCQKLEIPLHRIDFIKEYWDYVFTYFLEELKKGRTPNPDIMCNKYIKFDFFIKKAQELGADYVATGHYAKTLDGHLYKAHDLNKDQSYFLSFLTKDQLKDILFPLGELQKREVREIAKKYELATAIKKDSTGICFIGERKFKKFLENYLPNEKGNIINIETKEKVGEHIGVMYYTIGQRRGLNLGGNDNKFFIVGKDVSKKILYVAPNDNNEYLYSDACLLEDVNIINELNVTKCSCKFRYRSQDIDVNIEKLDNNQLLLKYPQRCKSVTPGQAAVLYYNNECLGGGIIKEIYKNNEKLWYL